MFTLQISIITTINIIYEFNIGVDEDGYEDDDFWCIDKKNVKVTC